MAVTRLAGRSGYLGTLGALTELPSVSALTDDHQRDISVKTTLGGRRVAFAAPAARRAWSATLPGQRPAEAGRLLELVRSSPGPFVWVSPFAQVTNMLTADQAALTTAPAGGYITSGFLAGDSVSRSAVAPSVAANVLTFGPVPVVAGYPVTGSVFVPGTPAASTLMLRFLDATGQQVGSDVSWTAGGAGSVPARLAVTAGTVPAGAAQVVLRVAGVSKLTRPAITWTAQALDWSAGHGCVSAVVTDFSGDVRATFAMPWAPRTQQQSLTITEVG